jgi:hypothetical protein
LIEAQLAGILKRKAGIFNVCGSQGTVTPDEKTELMIPLALGGISLRRNLGLDQIKRIKRTRAKK